MRFPKLGFVEFVILGALLEGEVPGETLRRILREEFDWLGVENKFFLVIGRMKRFKLITIHKQVASTERYTRQESCYSISDTGRAQWKYSYAFFRTLCDRWSPQAESLPAIEVPPDHVESVPKERREARLPNSEEIALILREAPAEFGAIFKLAVGTGKCIVALSAIEITDLDRTTWTLQISGRGKENENSTIVVPENCRKLVAAAISRRRSGPVFVTGSGLAWREENLRMCWRRLKTKLNLPKGTVMPSARFLDQVSVGESEAAIAVQDT